MPAKYHQFPPALYTPQFRALSHHAQLALLYIKTAPMRASEGCFLLPLVHIGYTFKLSEAEVKAALMELGDYIAYDYENEVVLDLAALEFYEPIGWQQLQGAVYRLIEVPRRSPLLARFYNLALELCPNLANAINGSYTYTSTDKRTGEVHHKNVKGDPRFPFDGTPYPIDEASAIPHQYPIDALSRAEVIRDRAGAESGAGGGSGRGDLGVVGGEKSKNRSGKKTHQPGCDCAKCQEQRDAEWKRLLA